MNGLLLDHWFCHWLFGFLSCRLLFFFFMDEWCFAGSLVFHCLLCLNESLLFCLCMDEWLLAGSVFFHWLFVFVVGYLLLSWMNGSSLDHCFYIACFFFCRLLRFFSWMNGRLLDHWSALLIICFFFFFMEYVLLFFSCVDDYVLDHWVFIDYLFFW